MQSHVEEKAAFLQSKGNLCLQPHVVVLCDDVAKICNPDNVIAYAIISSDVFYEFHSVAEAVELCLKAVFLFNLQFPNAAYSSWLFLQKAVLSITSKYDRDSVKVTRLLNDTK